MTSDEEVVRTHTVRPHSGEKDAKIAVCVGGCVLLAAACYFFYSSHNQSDNKAATGVQEAAHAALIAGPSAAPAR